VAVESTGNARFFVETVRKHVKRVVVVDPNNFDIIRRSTKKTDEVDARALALFLSKEMLPEARMKTGLQAELGSMVATRDTLVKQRTALINAIHNVLNAHGLKRKKEELTTARGLDKVLPLAEECLLPALARVQLAVLVEQIKGLNEGIKKLDTQIVEKGRRMQGHRNLASIKGIGEKGATILLSVIGDIDDFADQGKLAAYFGIVPRVRKSNDTVYYGRITKDGSKLGRTTLVQCTLVAIRYSPYLAAFYAQVAKRRGKGKAIIATARKLLGVIYNTLKNGWVFTDFPAFQYSTT
jgi:transposase